jgi:hypothetical protein
MTEVERLRASLKQLADEAATAVCQPRLFYENQGGRQQRLGQAVAAARLDLLGVDYAAVRIREVNR